MICNICKKRINSINKMPRVIATTRPNLEGVARNHPVLPIVLATNNPSTKANLPDFLEQELRHAENNQIPLTMAEFYHDYVLFLVRRHQRESREQHASQHFGWNVNAAIQNLAKMAFIHFVRNARITEGMVSKLMSSIGVPRHIVEMDIEVPTFGFLVQDGVVGRRPVYRFKEQLVMEYLVARHLLNECLRKVVAGKSEDVLSGAVYECMKRLPATGDIWRMTFALLNDDKNTRSLQGQILTELIDVSKTIDGLSSFDVTSMCIEAIYESRNEALLTEHIDEFTMNETINYSNAFVPKSRRLYSISAVGYFVRACNSVYGLHMSNFGLNAERVALLADPVNAVSDNYVQVLNISRNPLGCDGMRRLQRFIVKASFLTHLDMSECELGCSGVAILSEYFMCLPLVYLNLANNEIGDKGMIRLLGNFKYLENLEWLDLSNNDLTDVSMTKFGEQLSHLSNLRSLDIRSNNIGDATINSVSHALVNLPRLSHVMLAENRGKDNAASRMISHAWKTKSLRHININLNKVPPEGILGLRRVTMSRDMLEMPAIDNMECGEGDSDFEADDTLNSTIITLDDSQDVSFDIITPWEMDRSASMDLLAGRPDRNRAVQLRRNTTRTASLPRMKDVRRSWHGVSSSFREGLRTTRDSLSRSSVRDSLRNTTSSLHRGLRNSTTSLRNSFRRSNSRLSDRLGQSSSSQQSVPQPEVESKKNGTQEDRMTSSVEQLTPRMYSETSV